MKNHYMCTVYVICTHIANIRSRGKTVPVVFKYLNVSVHVGRGWGAGGVTPTPLNIALFLSWSVVILLKDWKDDVTTIPPPRCFLHDCTVSPEGFYRIYIPSPYSWHLVQKREWWKNCENLEEIFYIFSKNLLIRGRILHNRNGVWRAGD